MEILDHFNTSAIASTNSQANKMVRKTVRLTFISASLDSISSACHRKVADNS